jgi:TonB family protein
MGERVQTGGCIAVEPWATIGLKVQARKASLLRTDPRPVIGLLLALAVTARARAADDNPSSSPPAAPQAGIADMVEQPDNAEMHVNFPPWARRNHITGKVVFRCVVAPDGALADCRILAEDPLGDGFGQATLNITQYWRFRPRTADGAPTAGAAFQRTVIWLPPPP